MESNETAPMSDGDSMVTERIETGPKLSFLTSNRTREGAENRMGPSVVRTSATKRLRGADRHTSIKAI